MEKFIRRTIEQGPEGGRTLGDYEEILKFKRAEEIQYESEKKPKLRVGAMAQKELGSLLGEIGNNARNKNLVGVVKCWNKSPEELKAFLGRVRAMQEVMPELKGVIVAINADQDKDGKTRKGLEVLIESEQRHFSVVPLEIEKYSWTAGINGPAALLEREFGSSGIYDGDIDIFNFSFGIEFDKSELEKLAELYRKNKFVATIRTDQGRKPEINSKSVKEIIRNPFAPGPNPETPKLFENPDILALARNTATIVPLADIAAFGGYDSARNETMGMEDEDFIVRLLLDALKKNKIGKAKSILRSLEQPVYYNDHDWDALPPEKRKAKLENERKATTSVAENLLAWWKKEVDFVTPKERQDFKFE